MKPAVTRPIPPSALTATYSPEDNKLRLYASTRLDADTYARVRAAGFIWAAKQQLFVAPAWTPAREDLLTELCGDIGDEDMSLTERAEERADRFTEYREHRTADAESARKAVSAIADNIPLGQPILVGHHSERHARRDAERIENGMRRAVKMWQTAEYWKARAAGAIRNAKYKERPDVRRRRIKKLEAEKRGQERHRDRARQFIAAWTSPDHELTKARAIAIANHDSGYYTMRHEFPNGYIGPLSLWEAAGGRREDETPIATPEQVRDKAIRNHEATIAHAERWIEHLDNRLTYERAMLAAADKAQPEKGGACRCWASPRGGWSLIQRVNKVSVTVLDNWGNGGADFTRTIEFDKLHALMSRADVDDAREAGRLVNETPRGFHLADAPPPKPPRPEPPDAEQAKTFDALRDTLKAGVQVVSAPQLFPTPADVARQIIDLADLDAPGLTILEPSAGTGALLAALPPMPDARITAVEIIPRLAEQLRQRFPAVTVHAADFLTWTSDQRFDRILMNPPFVNADDIRHIQRARALLAAGGILVAVCANGPRQQDKLQPLADEWIDLPAGAFAESGTNVRAAIVVFRDTAIRQLAEAIDAESGRLAEVPFTLSATQHTGHDAAQLGLFGAEE